jgi:hypothetical protein
MSGHVLLRPWIGRSNVLPLPPALPSQRGTYAYLLGLADSSSYAQATPNKKGVAWVGVTGVGENTSSKKARRPPKRSGSYKLVILTPPNDSTGYYFTSPLSD